MNERVKEAIAEVKEVVKSFYSGSYSDTTDLFSLIPADNEDAYEFEGELNKVLCSLYDAAADAYYLKKTKKTYEELEVYMQFGRSSWADGAYATDFPSIETALELGEEAAWWALNKEAEEAEEL